MKVIGEVSLANYKVKVKANVRLKMNVSMKVNVMKRTKF